MILQIDFVMGDVPATAVLGEDRRWTCEAIPAIAGALNALYSPIDDGPADGQPGWGKAHAANRWLKGTVTIPELEPAPDDAIF